MRAELEWIEATDPPSDSADHLDFGPRRPLRRAPRIGWLSLAAIAMAGTLVFGPSITHTRQPARGPSDAVTLQSCQPVVVRNFVPGQTAYVATDDHVVVSRARCLFVRTP